MTCQNCGLWRTRKNIVQGRGDQQEAEILFIGEAPGKSEDIRGEAFVGRSGRLLDEAIRKAEKLAGASVPYWITNIVACRPCDGRDQPNRPPKKEEIEACFGTLEEEIYFIDPRRIIYLGKTAGRMKQKIEKLGYAQGIAVPHPAYILRKGGKEAPEFMALSREIAEVIKSLRGKEVI